MKKIIFDFDHTLFDTKAFGTDIIAFLRSLNIPEENIIKTWSDFTSENSGNYDFDEHVKRLAIEHQFDIEAGELKLFRNGDLKKYVHPETPDALSRLKSAGHRLFLLTKGIERFQLLKIRNSGLESFFEEIRVCTEKKENEIEKFSPEPGSLFINDNLPETERIAAAHPDLNCILFVRPDASTFYDADKVNFQTIYSISEIESLIK